MKKREEWKENELLQDRGKYVFCDESGVNINMTRRYGRSKNGTRVDDATPLNVPRSTTILGTVKVNGKTTYTTYQGGTTKEKFLDFLENILIPSLNPDDILVMDNLRAHRCDEVISLLNENKVRYVFLPPYSPDLNPIEKMWSKVKAKLRQIRARTIEDLGKAIQCAFESVHASDCEGWFLACGYAH